MIEDVWLRFNNDLQHAGIAAQKVRRQNLNCGLGRLFSDRADGLRKVLGSAVFHVITVHGGDDNVIEAEFFDRIGHAPRLKRVKLFGRFASRDIAEGAGARADLSHDHHGRVTLVPTFAYVGASSLFADRDELFGPHDLARGFVPFAHWRFDANPIWLFRLGVVDLMGLLGVPLSWNF